MRKADNVKSKSDLVKIRAGELNSGSCLALHNTAYDDDGSRNLCAKSSNRICVVLVKETAGRAIEPRSSMSVAGKSDKSGACGGKVFDQ